MITSQVCIRKENGDVVGAGFLVDEQHILTCAHVVAEALEWSGGAFSPEPPQELVSLDFPRLDHRTILTARVVFWQPASADWSGGDIAGLQLEADAPVGAEPVRFALAEDVWDHDFRAFGFPSGQDNGVWATGRLLDRQASNWIQIEDNKTGSFAVIPGFSGGAVWDEQMGGVVGMVVAAIVQPETKGAFVIPLDVLLAAWPLIKPITFQRVFLSAAPDDAVHLARLRADLEAHDILVWDEQHGPVGRSAIPERVRQQGIRLAQALVVIVSSQTSSSLIVKEHLRLADLYQRRRVFVWMGDEERNLEPGGWRDLIWIDAHGPNYISGLQTIGETLHERISISGILDALKEPTWEPRNPYIGLRAFTAQETKDFFGRELFIEQLCSDIQKMLKSETQTHEQRRLLTVIGSSGSGKSSVVMAGVLPQLMQSEDSKSWVYMNPMVPGKDPIEALADAFRFTDYFRNTSFETLQADLKGDTTNGLHRLAKQLATQQELTTHQKTQVVLFVDQFEELFTLTVSEEHRRRFLDLLRTAVTEPEGPLLVLLTLRADFSHQLIAYPDFYRLFEPTLKILFPLEIEELRAAIERPAAQSDVQLFFEGNLVGDLLFEVQGQAGALPLLQFTLQQLFERRTGHRLTQHAYKEIGKVSGALAQYADVTYEYLPKEQQPLARVMFLRLLELGASEQETTRRRAALTEFAFDDQGQTRLMQETMDVFVKARLLTTNANESTGTTTIEVSHEALIREWPLLASWLREARKDIPLQQAISEDTAEWERRGKRNDRLYRGSQLKEARTWAKRNPPSRDEATFLRASAAYEVRTRVSVIAIFLLVVLTIGWLSEPGLQAGLTSLLYRLFPSPTVTNIRDGEAGSLRSTIAKAPSGSTITFDASLNGQTIVLTKGNLIISRALTIRGPGENELTLSGNGAKYHLQVAKEITVTIQDLTITSFNSSGIKNYGTLKLLRCIVTHNRTDGNGGGIENFETGMLTLEQTIVSDNSAASDNPVFFKNPIFENGGGIYNQGTLMIMNSTVSYNIARNDGGGIVNGEYSGSVTVVDQRRAKATIINSTVSHNQACLVGGGIVNGENRGMAILDLRSSTVSYNQAGFCLSDNTTSIVGGGIYSNSQALQLSILNSTILGNLAYHGTGSGIGISNGQSTINFCTIYENSKGGGIAVTGGSVTMRNSIVAGNNTQDISGMIFSSGYNLIQNVLGAKIISTQPVSHDLSGVFPQLGPVVDNGGPLALLPRSPATDYIPLNACHVNGITTDQRGMRRPDNNEQNCDIGADESSG